MKMFKLDFGWEGAYICVADSRDIAANKFVELYRKEFNQPDYSVDECLSEISEYSLYDIVSTCGG